MKKYETLDDLKKEYDKLQKKYGDKFLDSIYNGGCSDHPDVMFVFMNPTGRNIASSKEWTGPKSPWIGTKNIWDLFEAIDLIDAELYKEIKSIKGSDWTVEFTERVYKDVENHRYFITNLGKCTQIDARPLPDSVYKEYLHFLECEIDIVKPKVIVLFGNQVSSIVLGEKISVSDARKKAHVKEVAGVKYKCFPVFYPVGNGRFNIDKSIEDLKWIIEKEVKCDDLSKTV